MRVGNHDNGDQESKKCNVKFNAAFPRPPIVFACAQSQGTYSDAFSCTILQTNNNGFTFNVGRLGDDKGWGQDLHVGWVAVDSNNPHLQAWTLEMGSREDDRSSHNVNFKLPQHLHDNAPKVHFFACAKGEGDYRDNFSVCLKNSNQRGGTFCVSRAQAGADGWGQKLRLNVLAVSEAMFRVTTHNIGKSDGRVKQVPLKFAVGLPRRPAVLVMGQHQHGAKPNWGDCFGSCVGNMTNNECNVHLHREDDDSGWGQDTTASVVVFP